MCVVQQSIEHGCRQRLIVSEGAGPLSERQIAGEYHAAVFVSLGDHVEEQVCFLSAERQIADLIDDQELRTQNGSVEVLFEATLCLGDRELQHEISGAQ